VMAATGWTSTAATALIAGVRVNMKSAYLNGTAFWPYSSKTPTTKQDADHNGYTIDSAYRLDPVWTRAILVSFLNRIPDTPTAPWGLGASRVVPLSCGYAADALPSFEVATQATEPGALMHAAQQGYAVLAAC
jgi:hypothetical protein